MVGQEILGFIGVLERETRDFRENVAFLEALGSQLAIALQHAFSFEKLQATLDTLPDLMLEIDANGRICDFRWPQPWRLKSSPDGCLGRTVGEVLPAKVADQITLGLLEASKTGRNTSLVQSEGPEGETAWFELSITAKGEVRGEQATFIALCRDVTEETVFRRRSQRARQMEALGQFAAGIAHDFKNSLMVIQGCSDLMLREIDDSEAMLEHLEVVQRATRNAEIFTGSLLSFSREEISDMRSVDLGVLIESLIPTLERVTPPEIEVSHSVAEDGLLVRCDRVQIERVILNLCANARDAMPKGGDIRIHLGLCDIDQAYVEKNPWAKPGTYAFCAVSDNGTGMDAQTLERVLDPFYTTKGPGGGSGIGLSSAYNVLKCHGGMIEITSRLGEGTTCIAYLPFEEGAACPEPDPMEKEMIGGSETVLVVDDNPDLLMVIGGLLESLGYKTLTAHSGAEALQVLRLTDESVALVISDLTMPGVSGEDLCRLSRELFPDLPFLFCSGNRKALQNMKSESRRASEVVEKPFDIDLLALRVREILDPRAHGKDM